MSLFRRKNTLTATSISALVIGLTLVSAPIAMADSIPTLRYAAVDIENSLTKAVPGPNGSITVPCRPSGSGDLKTYDTSGQVTRQLSRSSQIDGVTNCIQNPVIDKNGRLYGVPYGSSGWGPNLLAYDGNTLKWKYPVGCGTNSRSVAVGGNGNIYTVTWASDGAHLIGLTPDVAPPFTHPAKVLDVKIPNDCSIELFTFRDGLMLRGQNSGFQFFGYRGNFLSKPTISQFWDARLNADGTLFDLRYAPYAAGSVTGANVALIDPLTGVVVGEYPVSSPGANVQGTQLFPLPGGGVVALNKEQKVAGGVPVMPIEYVYSLTTLTAEGVKTHPTIQLPNSSAQGALGDIYASVSGDGKLAIVRDLQMNTGLSYPPTISTLRLGVFDPATGTWAYEHVMSGDLQKPGGPSGFFSDAAPVTADNTLFVMAKCSGNCGGAGKKLYPIQMPGMGMSYPTGEVLATPVLKPYVALGDSFSSGDGVPPFAAGTDTSTNACHRSHYAYPRMLARIKEENLSLIAGGFHACGGAETQHIVSTGKNGEPKQLDHLNDSTEVVTLTIGGNDIDFTFFGTDCVVHLCNFGSTRYNTTLSLIGSLSGALENTYKMVLEKAPNAEVYVLSYPQIAPTKTTGDAIDPRCSYLARPIITAAIGSWENAQAAREVVSQLNAKIANIVEYVRNLSEANKQLHYVEVNGTSSPFEGHTMCDPAESSYFNNVDQWIGHPAYALHPNRRGQGAYGQLILEAIRTNDGTVPTEPGCNNPAFC